MNGNDLQSIYDAIVLKIDSCEEFRELSETTEDRPSGWAVVVRGQASSSSAPSEFSFSDAQV